MQGNSYLKCINPKCGREYQISSVDFQCICKNLLDVIKDNVSPQNFKTWFEPIVPINIKDKTYLIINISK